jgi:beta-aspartyl-peptidase (threonine type)
LVAFVRGTIIVHGGAGFWGRTVRKGVLGVRNAASSGAEILSNGGAALDAVMIAVKVMEDDPVFNAGLGASLTVRGTAELDASIMDGRDLSAGAVALVRNVKNPVQLARLVMERSDHVVLSGATAEKLAEIFHMPKRNPVTKERQTMLRQLKAGHRRQRIRWVKKNAELLKAHPEILGDTVGAVAVDSKRNFAAASSTGGVMMKLPGRIGDTPQIGSGLYADNRAGAATVTGVGEVAIRLTISKTVCLLMERGLTAEKAAIQVVRSASQRLNGAAGVIAIDRKGRVAAIHNTPYMPWALGYANSGEAIAKPHGRIIAALN